MQCALPKQSHRHAPFQRHNNSAGPRRVAGACHAVSTVHEPREDAGNTATNASGKDFSSSSAANRRVVLLGSVLLPAAALVAGKPAVAAEGTVSKYEPMDALKGKDYGKPRMTYKDYTTTPSGLQFQDLKVGEGEAPQAGDTVVIDWDGYTIGYYGRPFEARNKPKGSSFSGDNKDFYRFVLGDGKVIPAFEEAVASMKPGGIRRIIVPVELGYPDNDWRRLGPKPSTFAGDRALDFVLANKGMIDKTLLFDIELVRVLPGRG